MTTIPFSTPRARIGSAVLALAMTGALGVALILGLAVRATIPTDIGQAVAVFEIPTPHNPRPPTERRPDRDTRAPGRAAPPNVAARATEVAAPVPLIPVAVDPFVVIAERPEQGVQASSGAAPVAGPGSGAGGAGEGTGGGGRGTGRGAGDPDAIPPRQIRGRIADSDYPRELADAGIGGRVTVLYRVETDGRVNECEIEQSSGVPMLDTLTCRLIRERFRFRPSRDGRGRAIPATILQNHEWVFDRRPAQD